VTTKHKLNLRLVDASAEARELFGTVEFMGHDITKPDWRFEIDTPTGGTVTFNSQATAAYVRAYVECEGWEVE
jgi:hypothetical protein